MIRSVIQNPKALSSKNLERGGDEMGMCVCRRRGGGTYRLLRPVHIWVCRYGAMQRANRTSLSYNGAEEQIDWIVLI